MAMYHSSVRIGHGGAARSGAETILIERQENCRGDGRAPHHRVYRRRECLFDTRAFRLPDQPCRGGPPRPALGGCRRLVRARGASESGRGSKGAARRGVEVEELILRRRAENISASSDPTGTATPRGRPSNWDGSADERSRSAASNRRTPPASSRCSGGEPAPRARSRGVSPRVPCLPMPQHRCAGTDRTVSRAAEQALRVAPGAVFPPSETWRAPSARRSTGRGQVLSAAPLSPAERPRDAQLAGGVANKILPYCRPLRGCAGKSGEMQIGKRPVRKERLLGSGGLASGGNPAARMAAGDAV